MFRFLLCMTAAATVLAEEPFRFDRTPGRLPKDVLPVHYDVRIEADPEKEAFRGEVKIEVNARKAVDSVVMNSLGLKIESTEVDGKPAEAKADDATQLLTLPGARLDAGKHTLRIVFSGKLTERQQGLYLTRYQLPGGEWRKALVTQMEATDARRMFPCWDEPVFRSTFAITAVVPGGHTVISNMPATSERGLEDGRREAVFATTPAMPSYLVALASAELEHVEDEVEGVKLRIFTTPGKKAHARLAMDATKKTLPYFNEYFGVKYPLPKLDQVAFPSVAAGGMENWGCIIYSDTALLHDDEAGAQSGRERVFGIVAHEIAHQWFGDLVTMAWWDNLWLNEGFASWMATKASDKFNPSWKLWLRAAGSKEHAMRLDARKTTHPIQQPVHNEADAMSIFDEITYQKGQSFLRMLESWLGEVKFREGMRLYFSRHANSNTTTADLWRALGDASKMDVAAMAAGWTEQPGFPVIEAAVPAEGKLRLRQRRFTIHQKDAAPLRWRVPVLVKDADDEEARVVMLDGDETVIEVKLPAVVNAGAVGYFRVHYTGAAWEALKPVLARLGEADRLAVADDTWALVQAGALPFARWIEVAMLLRNDPSPVVGGHFTGVLGHLDFLARGHDARPALREWARAFLEPRWRRTGWDAAEGEEPAVALHRAALIRTLGGFGDMKIVAEAQARVAKFMSDPASLRGDIRGAALDLAGRHATGEQWERLHALAKKTADTQLKNEMYFALACAREPALAERALAISLSGELPSKNAARMVQNVAGGGQQPELAWKFAKPRLAELFALQTARSASEYVAWIFRSFTDVERAEELASFSKANLPPDAERATAIAEDDIRFNAQFKAAVLPGLAELLKRTPVR